MPCDTRLLTFNERLRLATERQNASDKRLAECQSQIERAKASLQAAQEGLDRAIFDEATARQAHVDWLYYLNTLPDNGSQVMRQKLVDLFNANEQLVLNTQSARETVSSFQKAVNEANGDFAIAQAAQWEIAEERNLITGEIAKLSSVSR